MKKILGVVLASALVAGAFAQVTTGVDFRTRVDVADWTFKKDSDAKAAYLKQKHQADDTKIGVSAAGKSAGVTAEVTFNLNNTTLGMGDVYGYFTVKGLTFTAGKFDSRFTKRLHQAKSNAIGLSILEPYKLGSAKFNISTVTVTAGGTKTNVTLPNAIVLNFAHDADNITHGTDLALVGDYTFAIGESKLLIKASIFNSNPKFKNVESGCGFEAAYQSSLFSIDAIVKVPDADQVVAGLYFRMMPMDMLDFVVGATLGFDKENKYYANEDVNILIAAFDARARVKPLDPLTISVMGNFSFVSAKASGTGWDAKAYSDSKYVALNAEYALNDMFTLFGEAGYFDAEAKAYNDQSNIKFQVGTNIKPVENVKVSGAIRADVPLYSDTPAKGTPVFGLSIPVAMHIAF